MKEYKPTWCVSFLYAWAMMFAVCLPMMVVVAVAVDGEGQETFWTVLLGCVAAMLLWGAVLAVAVAAVSLVMGLFTRKKVQLTDTSVSYQGQCIRLDDIRYVTLYLPKVSRRDSRPQILTVWADNKNYLEIKRPSIALIAALKKRCVFAAFDVDDWKSELKMCFWIQLGVMGVAVLATVFGAE